MDIPPSSVLDRVKLFLPQIEKANKELESVVRESGAEAVRLDLTMVERTSADSEDEDEGEPPSEEQPPTVNLEFAIGDFDGTPIAIAEENESNDDKSS